MRQMSPQNEEKNQAFVKVTKFLEENDDEQITVGDLVEKMKEYLNDTESEAYGRSHMKTELLEYFGDKIIITDINGKPNVVTFKTTATRVSRPPRCFRYQRRTREHHQNSS